MQHKNRSAFSASGLTREAYRSQLRKQLITARETMSPSERSLCTQAITAHLQALLAAVPPGVPGVPGVLGFCWPYRGEFDARPLIINHLARGRRACLPVIREENAAMEFLAWTEHAPMRTGHYDIPTPDTEERLQPDWLLMPLNGFDHLGYRIGYGGGYFDRTLAALKPQPVSIGLGFELARVEDTLPGEFDLPMQLIVTEAGLFLPGEEMPTTAKLAVQRLS